MFYYSLSSTRLHGNDLLISSNIRQIFEVNLKEKRGRLSLACSRNGTEVSVIENSKCNAVLLESREEGAGALSADFCVGSTSHAFSSGPCRPLFQYLRDPR